MIVAIVISILWIILPFAVFSIHTMMKTQIKLMREAAERERIRDSEARNERRNEGRF